MSGRGADALERTLRRLHALADPTRLPGMARYGIATDRALGVTVTELRAVAREIGRDHDLARALWDTGIHEARILATIVEDPGLVTREQAEAWVLDVRSWDLCDALCGNLLDRTPFAFGTALEWSERDEPFVRRAAFALMACAAVHRRDEPDQRFEALLDAIRARATDERTEVTKAASWALRQIGKRSMALNRRAIEVATDLRTRDSRGARWVGADAMRELTSEKVRTRLGASSR